MSSRQLAAQASEARRVLRSSGIGFPTAATKRLAGLASRHLTGSVASATAG